MSQNKRTIMILDDEQDLLDISQEFISNAGFEALAFNHAEKAIEYLYRNNVDGILSDIRMAGTDGIHFFNKLAAMERLPRVFVFISAFGEEYPVAAELIGKGVDKIFKKPAFYYDIAEYFRVKFKEIDNRSKEAG